MDPVPLDEDEFVGVFLRGELESSRFGGAVRDALKARGLSEALVTQADLRDVRQNRWRRELLGTTRGYTAGTGLFDGFPSAVAWSRAVLAPADLAAVRYTDYSYWVELSAGTRLPVNAAAAVDAGRSVFGQSNEPFLAAASAVRSGLVLPEIIVVGPDSHDLVVLEGHLRLTAYALCRFPTALTVVMGLSPEVRGWSLFGHGAAAGHGES
ncbi:hypothetical protein [Pedococcus sp. 5OH_020]|uniref:hypothetical protein n=1 Tax=Pedococcus sp. 5OH_020 TaxID=2989814 RepID=UPI0022E9E6C7|nr:hypothetical protein [Pedococcus sp. 5OH_020]